MVKRDHQDVKPIRDVKRDHQVVKRATARDVKRGACPQDAGSMNGRAVGLDESGGDDFACGDLVADDLIGEADSSGDGLADRSQRVAKRNVGAHARGDRPVFESMGVAA